MLSLPCVLSNTAHLPVHWQQTKPVQLNGGTDTKTVPASKIKGQCSDNTPNTLILANKLPWFVCVIEVTTMVMSVQQRYARPSLLSVSFITNLHG